MRIITIMGRQSQQASGAQVDRDVCEQDVRFCLSMFSSEHVQLLRFVFGVCVQKHEKDALNVLDNLILRCFKRLNHTEHLH